ncbi:MAG: hypothetical protein V3S16_14455 [Candidatus Desulfatibia sp.]|uniref:hypothetical protein n=1 Tax=Candidatus Desulfatibia sp. TaxID=3101189 RepID=UPI002F311F0F
MAVNASPLQDRLYDKYGVDLNGFIEGRQGWRLRDDPYEKDSSISEMRMQLDVSKDADWGVIKLKGDLVGDQVEEKAYAELRELNFAFSPLDFMDLKIGRQTLTWGTGDLLFINDLFPKDWQSFFIGRDDEYLKAPSDAIKGSLFFDLFDIDLIYSPVFNASRYVDGTRLSYWNSMLGRRAGQDFIFTDHERNSYFKDSEFAARVSKNITGIELGLYGYSGFWKTPEGLDSKEAKLWYPRLSAYGASARGALWGGIGNLEIGYYDSRDDRDGDDALVRNSEIRTLAGFERELASDFTGGFQYYQEWMQKYDSYKSTLPAGTAPKDEVRHVFTLRLTKLLMNQNLRLSLFTYYSPSDQDGYIRPKIHYKVTDQWAMEVGANIFAGKDDYTFFGQFQDNTNAHAGVRWSF